MLLAALYLGACTQTQAIRIQQQEIPASRVVLMPVEVLMYEVPAAGSPVPRADWTQAGRSTIAEAIEQALSERGHSVSHYRSPPGVAGLLPTHVAAVNMHDVVLQAALQQRRQGSRDRRFARLKTEAAHADWSLGDTVAPLRRDSDADYALFVHYQQGTASAGRAALTALALVLFGVPSATSQSVGVASLVDLHSGQLLWAQLLQAQALDVSRPDDVRSRVHSLLSGAPL